MAAQKSTVHPHTRGEYYRMTAKLTGVNGSPPHPWGIRRQLVFKVHTFTGSPPHPWGIRMAPFRRHIPQRFTPTPVGNTPVAKPQGRVWRFTPTPVGNTVVLISRVAATTVHPHTRGEYSIRLSRSNSSHAGSPPHPWGILNLRDKGIMVGRFTPTPVGNTPVSVTCCEMF